MSSRLIRSSVVGLLLAMAACQNQVVEPNTPLSAAKGGGKPPSTCAGLPENTSSLVITPPSSSLAPGETAELAVANEAGADVPDCAVKWSSSDATIATVNNLGLVLAVAPGGPVTIKAQSGGKGKPMVGTAFVVVTEPPPPPVASIEITPNAPVVYPGQVLALSATLRDANGQVITGPQVTWSSDNTAVAIVGTGGELTGVSLGGATISAEIGGVAGTAVVTVKHVAMQVAVGHINHTCALYDDGRIACWGSNEYGKLGVGDLSPRATPVQVATVVRFSALDAGGHHNCALTAAGVAYCWGWNGYGQLGDGSVANSPVPVAVSGSETWSQVVAVDEHSCGIGSSATYCWGRQDQYATGTGYNAPANQTTPVMIGAQATNPRLLAEPGPVGTCGLGQDGNAFCWGWPWYGQLGTSSGPVGVEVKLPALVVGGQSWLTLATGNGRHHMCGIVTGGAAYCWGLGNRGALGTGYDATGIYEYVEYSPALVTGGHAWKSLTIGSSGSNGGFTCGLTDPGSELWCWGGNEFGQLVNGGATNYSPFKVTVPVSFAKIAAGGGTTCAIDAAGDVYCTGLNGSGQAGNGNTTNQYGFVKVVLP